MMAKKRTKNQDDRLPYDAKLAQQWVEAAAEALRVKRWNLTHCAMCVYGRTQAGFADAVAATHTLNHQDENLRRVLNAGHQQWTRQTGLPPLDADDNNWRIVAVAAGASDESLRAIEDGDRKGLDLLVGRITAWCKSRVNADDGWSEPIMVDDFAKQRGVKPRTVNRWLNEATGPVEVRRVRRGWIQHREHRQ